MAETGFEQRPDSIACALSGPITLLLGRGERHRKKNAKNRVAHSCSTFVPIRKDVPFWAAAALQVLGLAGSVPTFLLGQELLARTKSECGSPGTGRNR